MSPTCYAMDLFNRRCTVGMPLPHQVDGPRRAYICQFHFENHQRLALDFASTGAGRDHR